MRADSRPPLIRRPAPPAPRHPATPPGRARAASNSANARDEALAHAGGRLLLGRGGLLELVGHLCVDVREVLFILVERPRGGRRGLALDVEQVADALEGSDAARLARLRAQLP